MAFLFKSKKNQDRALSSRDGNSGSQGSIQSSREKGSSQHRATPTGSLNSIENDAVTGSPNQPLGHARRGGSMDQTQQVSDLPFRNGPPVSNPNASLYPWSQRRFNYTSSHPSPFPRYGAAVNSLSSKEGDIYLMGGLVSSSTVKGDLWMIEAGGNMACYPLATTAEGPGPRVGHSSLLVGNAFIVYGGDTKIDESDVLDETLYLLNTSTRQWSRALPAGPRPSGRYGHTLNIIGSRIFIFGGQVEGFFMNDLSAFDLNQLQAPNNRWELLISGEVSPQIPAARTNHTVITCNDQMYLFGGTNGFQWFNDVWCYDSKTNQWTQLDCIGFIPSPREGHAAAIVDDVMYVFGGRTEDGTDLGDLAAFRISSRRWYTFQNMGPSPSPRSGHSMTTVGKSIVVIGGEPSEATINDLGILYVLDTTKIRYPADAPQGAQKLPQGRRPSTGESGASGSRQMPMRDGSNGPSDSRRIMGPAQTANAPTNGYRSPTNALEGPIPANTSPVGSRLPRAAAAQGPAGPPPQGPTPAKPSMDPTVVTRTRGASLDRSGPSASPQIGTIQSPTTREVVLENGIPVTNGRRTPQQQPPRTDVIQEELEVAKSKSRQGRSQGSIDSSMESSLKMSSVRPSSPPPPTRQPSNPLARRSSGRNSQTVALLKELDSARNRNAWYASELELARKAGFVPNATMNAALDAKAAETFDDEDRPLIEALLAMRTELANVQSAVDKQAIVAARQVAEADKQRDAAIQEAVYAKAKLAAHLGGSASSTPRLGLNEQDDGVRSSDMGRKLAMTLHLQKDLQSQIESMKADLSAEKKARHLAEDIVTAAQKRMSDLETYKQQTSAEVERLKTELHVAQRDLREHSVSSGEAIAALELLKIEKQDISSRYEEVVGTSKEHSGTFASLRSAIAASEDAKTHLESRIDDERLQREKAEGKLSKLKVEHEARTAELVAATQRLRDVEILAEKHANEAKTHREALLSGLDKMSTRDAPKASNGDAERATALQAQIVTLNGLVKKYQAEADSAASKLRSAEERIAGLEQYQEQTSKEGVSIRRQLQSALREHQGLLAANTDFKNRLASHQLETNAMMVQHNTLKDILSERGISPSSASRSRNLSSPQNSSPDVARVRELESKLAGITSAHEETKQAFAVQQHEAESSYREKISQLESDYQTAVHLVKSTEKVLKELTSEMSRYKADNRRLKNEMIELEDRLSSEKGASKAGNAESWEAERSGLQARITSLEGELQNSAAQLQRSVQMLKNDLNDARRQRDEAVKASESKSIVLDSHQKDLEQLQSENALLEQRAGDAEQKVAMLLNQVEHSVDNYRRQSRQLPGMNQTGLAAPPVNGIGMGHARTESSETESVYGGNGLDARNSAALDNLASELETLRSHWEATSKNYRVSTNFEFDTPARNGDDSNVGLSESLADWRKRLDTDDSHSVADNPTK